MSYLGWDEYGFNPWKRSSHPDRDYSFSEDDEYYRNNLFRDHPKFNRLGRNTYLTIDTKRAALIVSPSVVALVSYSGEAELSHGCGTIIEADPSNNVITVLTSARLIRHPTQVDVGENRLADNLKVVVHASADISSSECEICAYDFHFNLLVIKFTSPMPLPVASLRRIDDRLRFEVVKEKSFQLRPHSLIQRRPHSVKLEPGDSVVIVGRYFTKPFDLMVAPGHFSVERCEHDCKELFSVTCRISRCGDGAPIVNLSGEVIGVSFHGWPTCLLPINIAINWWDHYKTCGTLRHPSIGFEATSLYVIDINRVEKLIRRFPSIFGGLVVEKVVLGSSAHLAGLREDDIIVKFHGKIVESFLEFLEVMWDNVGEAEAVELVVAREGCLNFLTLKMMVVEATADEINKWPQWERC